MSNCSFTCSCFPIFSSFVEVLYSCVSRHWSQLTSERHFSEFEFRGIGKFLEQLLCRIHILAVVSEIKKILENCCNEKYLILEKPTQNQF